jgi:hypothetical protein
MKTSDYHDGIGVSQVSDATIGHNRDNLWMTLHRTLHVSYHMVSYMSSGSTACELQVQVGLSGLVCLVLVSLACTWSQNSWHSVSV